MSTTDAAQGKGEDVHQAKGQQERANNADSLEVVAYVPTRHVEETSVNRHYICVAARIEMNVCEGVGVREKGLELQEVFVDLAGGLLLGTLLRAQQRG